MKQLKKLIKSEIREIEKEYDPADWDYMELL